MNESKQSCNESKQSCGGGGGLPLPACGERVGVRGFFGEFDPALGFERRWVLYNGLAEASKVGPDWHGWLHHTFDLPPTEETVTPRPWWKPHRPNLTGTPDAYRPSGSTLAHGHRPPAT